MGRRFRVLVADDNEDAANALAMLLELSGYDVQVAHDGEAALRLAEDWPADAAVLDIRMPGKDGYEVARALRARVAHRVVLIAHSGQLNVRQRDMAAASLFDLCFSKGTEFTEMREQLEDLLKRAPGTGPVPGPGGGTGGGPTGSPSVGGGTKTGGRRGGCSGGSATSERLH